MEPLAIVGVGCRFPGGISDLAGLWTVLLEGRDLVTEVPPDRFDTRRFLDEDPLKPGKSYTFAGAFLEDIAGFDAEYFEVSPREAGRMDPQQRLLLEMAVEALDDAGLDLAGSDTAVFVGVSTADYGSLQGARPETITAYTNSGVAASIAANRISHFFDLHGPSMTVDTACSSALVAVHQAAECLRAGRAGAALAGGINVLISPSTFVGFAKAQMLSPTGRCHSFSAAADGYVRAEGGGVVVLKRLADALAHGDRIHAVLPASGVNTDGRTAGLALPNGSAQEALLREVYDQAGIDPGDLVYLEAHGTGTPAGDPAECGAIGAALGTRRTTPLPVGSVKSNLGHLEAAAGMAGLLKAILVLRHGVIPASVHGEPLNPVIDFPALNLTPVHIARPVESPGRRPVAGVNAFGFGGANAHVVLAAPDPQAEPEPPPGPLPLVVSARHRDALAAATQRITGRLADLSDAEFYDMCWTACRRRRSHPYRVAVLADSAKDAADRLAGIGEGVWAPGVESGVAAGDGRVAFAFSGNGSQWAGMAVDLLACEPVFRAALDEVDALLAPRLGWSVLDRLDGPMERTEVAQPALFAVQIGLVELLRARGIRPAAALGHSVGEVAAAYAAGALDLSDATLVIAERSRAQAETAGSGRMAAVGWSQADALAALPGHPGLELAGVNSDQDVTVSGPAAELRRLTHDLDEQGVFVRELDLDYAFHSAAMDPIGDRLRAALRPLRPRHGRLPLLSTVTGGPLSGTELDAEYWWHNIRRPVLFAQAAAHLRELGIEIVLEIGPHPVLGTYLRRVAGAAAGLATLRRGADGPQAVRGAVAALLAHGGDIDWDVYFPCPGRVADLPAYPWQRDRHWNGDPSWLAEEIDHPLLGVRQRTMEPAWSAPLEQARIPWLPDHRFAGSIVLPAAAYVEMGLAAGRRVHGADAALEINDLDISRAMVLPEDGTDLQVQTSLSDEDGLLRIASRTGEWQLHARGRVRRLAAVPPTPLDLSAVRARTGAGRPAADRLYALIAAAGLLHGPSFQVLTELCVGAGEVLAGYTCRASAEETAAYELHPAVLDGALQATVPLFAGVSDGAVYLPVALADVRFFRPPAPTGFVHVRARTVTWRRAEFDLTITDETGQVAVAIRDCRLRRFAPASVDAPQIHTMVLRAAPRPGEVPPTPLPADLGPAAAGRLHDLQADCDAAEHGRFRHAAREATARYTARALTEILGGRREFSGDDLTEAGVLPVYDRLLTTLLDLTRRHGLLVHEDGRWRLADVPPAEPIIRDMVWSLPGHAADPVLRCRAGRHLADVLRGHRDPVELLFPDGAGETVESIYDEFPPVAAHNRLARALVAALADAGPLRILEVGAGTGGLTAALLPVLRPELTRYVFTDVSEAFFARARARFAAFDFVEYQSLDLDQNPVGQGFVPGDFDLVVAQFALHAARDLRQTLRWLRGLLAPGGRLIALEPHDSDALALPFGLFKGWWAFTDTDLRPTAPLLPPARWAEVLEDCGFGAVSRLGAGGQAAFSTLLARNHDAHPGHAPTGHDGRWLIAADEPGAAAAGALADALRAAGCQEVRVVPAHTDLCLAPGLTGVVYLAGTCEGTAVDRTIRRAAILRALAAGCDPAAGSALWLVTGPTGLLPAPERPGDPADAALWGVARCLGQERPELAVRRISWEPEADAGRLAAELLEPDAEDEVVLTRAGRFVPRPAEPAPAVTSSGEPPFRLELRDQGGAFGLAWVQAAPPPAPGPDEVVIEVRAAALNYRDVLWALGVLPDEVISEENAEALGFECAGVVTAVGSGVTGRSPGQRIMAVGPGAFGSHVVANADFTAVLPADMSYTAAATIPVAFATVQHGLELLARLSAGETVLVHGAAGGVGLAAVRYALAAGAEVIGTAGSPEKRDLLRSLGVHHVLDSRTLAFADHVGKLTGGRGVDVVLNSLAGEAIPRSLELLRPGGRFVELGKRDLYGNSRLLLRPLRNNVGFFAVDVDQGPRTAGPAGAAHARELFAELSRRVGSGAYRPLPHRVFPAGRIEEAYRLMLRSRHIGKIVIEYGTDLPVAEPDRPIALDPEGTYLVTGGLGGFGAATARWLAARGARHLALVGRRGPDSPEAATLLAGLGTAATAYAADVADREAMREVLAAIAATGHPLRGVVHAATVYDDGPLAELTADRFRSVLTPKIAGAEVLDELTRDLPLQMFVLYSSASGLAGNINQANYVAGNLFLEALARGRRATGRPGLAVAWGTIGEVGHVARQPAAAEFFARLMPPISPREAFAVLDDLLARRAVVAGAARYNWDALHDLLPRMDVPRLGGMAARRTAHSGQSVARFREALAAAEPGQALVLIEDAIVQAIADVLQTTPDRVDRTRPFDQLGIDSLMGAELLGIMRRTFGRDLPVMELMNSSGIRELSRQLLLRVRPAGDAEGAPGRMPDSADER